MSRQYHDEEELLLLANRLKILRNQHPSVNAMCKAMNQALGGVGTIYPNRLHDILNNQRRAVNHQTVFNIVQALDKLQVPTVAPPEPEPTPPVVASLKDCIWALGEIRAEAMARHRATLLPLLEEIASLSGQYIKMLKGLNGGNNEPSP